MGRIHGKDVVVVGIVIVSTLSLKGTVTVIRIVQLVRIEGGILDITLITKDRTAFIFWFAPTAV